MQYAKHIQKNTLTLIFYIFFFKIQKYDDFYPHC